MTGREFLLKECDGKLTNEDLSDGANQFCQAYFHDEQQAYGQYYEDYKRALSINNDKTFYLVEDSWGNYDTLEAIIDRRFKEWTTPKT